MSTNPSAYVKTRFAPSPTGRLHLGGLRTALFAYLLAKSHNGKFYLRIEDTDRERFDHTATTDIIQSLKWAGLSWEPEVLCQSQRLSIYQDYAHQLVASNHAYRCFCSKERLATLRHNHNSTGYDRACRELSDQTINQSLATNTPYVIRLKTPIQGSIEVVDGILSRISFPAKQLTDPIILKSDGYPTYHLAHVIDDKLTGITHVLRGQEWLSTFPLHQLIWQSLKWTMPTYYHLPLITAKDGGKLSKRNHSVSVAEYRAQGYLPAGLINFLVLLGWSYDDSTTLFSLNKLEQCFSPSGLTKSHAVFSLDKLNYLNNHYIQQLSAPEFTQLARAINPQLYRTSQLNPHHLDQIHLLYQSRLHTISELQTYTQFIHQKDLDYTAIIPAAQSRFSTTELKSRLKLLHALCSHLDPWQAATIKTHIKATIKSESLKMFDLLMPLRIALTAQLESPSIIDLCAHMGQTITINRIEALLTQLKE